MIYHLSFTCQQLQRYKWKQEMYGTSVCGAHWHSDATVLCIDHSTLNITRRIQLNTRMKESVFWFYFSSFFLFCCLPSAFAYENSQGNICGMTVKNDRRAEMSVSRCLLNPIRRWEEWRHSCYHRRSLQSLYKQIYFNYYYLHTVHLYCVLFITYTNKYTYIRV